MVHDWIRSRFTFWCSILIISFCCTAFVLPLVDEITQDQTVELENSQDDDIPAKLSLNGEDLSIQPGRPFWLVISMDLKNGWHSYWKNPGIQACQSRSSGTYRKE